MTPKRKTPKPPRRPRRSLCYLQSPPQDQNGTTTVASFTQKRSPDPGPRPCSLSISSTPPGQVEPSGKQTTVSCYHVHGQRTQVYILHGIFCTTKTCTVPERPIGNPCGLPMKSGQLYIVSMRTDCASPTQLVRGSANAERSDVRSANKH